MPDRPSKLDPYAEKLSEWRRREAGRPRKQRRTVKQLYRMEENIGGARPALAAHSKDGSAPGQTADSEASAPKPASPSGLMSDTLNKMASEACDFARQQPLTTAAIVGGTGCADWLVVGPSLGIDPLAGPHLLFGGRSAARFAERYVFASPWAKGVAACALSALVWWRSYWRARRSGRQNSAVGKSHHRGNRHLRWPL